MLETRTHWQVQIWPVYSLPSLEAKKKESIGNNTPFPNFLTGWFHVNLVIPEQVNHWWCFHFLHLSPHTKYPILPFLIFAESGPVRGQSAPCNIIAHLSVCGSVRSINAWVSNSSLNRGSTWRPVQSFLSGPVRSWSPTPCQLVSIVRARVLCLRARAPISWVVVAHSVPRSFEWFRLFVRARESSVSGLALVMKAWTLLLLKLCASSTSRTARFMQLSTPNFWAAVTTCGSQHRATRGSCVEEDRSRFHSSQHRLSQSVNPVHGAAARAARMRSAWMSAEAESSIEQWTALCSRVLKIAWNRLYMYILGCMQSLQAFSRLVSIHDRADWSCDSNSVRSNHSAWSPARHPGEAPCIPI